MLFLSPHLHFQIAGITTPSGRVTAEFFHGGAPKWAIEQAMDNQRFHQAWRGLPDDQPREAMISSFDTSEKPWDEETRRTVEEALLASPDHGLRFMLVEPPYVRLEEPWRGYDTTHHKKIPVIAKELDPESQRYALDYEKANQNRESIVAALTDLVGDDEEVVVAA